MSAILGWTLPVTVLVICVPMILYTTLGGVQAVAWTDVKQMFVVVGGMSAAVVILLYGILQHVGFEQALHLAGATGRLEAIDFRFDLRETYTFWSGMIGGTVPDAVVLRLRPEPGAALSDREVDRRGAALAADERVRQDPAAAPDSGERRPGVRLLSLSGAADALQPRLRRRRWPPSPRPASTPRWSSDFDARDRGATRGGGSAATGELSRQRCPGQGRPGPGRGSREASRPATQRYNDVNYVFPTFITTRMPVGLVGLMIAAIFAAAMSASGGELNALATATIIDFYKRHFVTKAADRHYLPSRSWRRLCWGLFACVVAMYCGQSGIADRGRQPLWVLLLRLAARRLHAGHPDAGARRRAARSGA